MDREIENERLKIQAVERESMIKRLTATSKNGGEHQNWQFIKTKSRLFNLQLQTNKKILLLEETIEGWNEAGNGDQW